jgi:hypothetical protein
LNGKLLPALLGDSVAVVMAPTDMMSPVGQIIDWVSKDLGTSVASLIAKQLPGLVGIPLCWKQWWAPDILLGESITGQRRKVFGDPAMVR